MEENAKSLSEIEKHEIMMRLENEDKKEDQIRAMAWFALWGVLLYPVGIVISDLFDLGTAASLLADIAPTYFISIAGLLAAFFGAEAYKKKNH